MFEHFHVFTKTELESRTEVKYETYAKEINVEARAMIDIAAKQMCIRDRYFTLIRLP